ncbi:LOW QUALITY PROTEIN: protein ROOT INITIATION DEFECTIVE 3 [Pyrus x bretschneideri]|uniref:LOW QUALITY PROTEIN: protein ROOT INITIATION DEFECTIVE 3 n=1 Tax=Pyrus x bretschneideri TaxID=225117 RepID=UPI000511A80D|nr:LOW QUALITY PROTEIN: protein ROOT INITIATION DEFECTIVE 3 [Pyrus x bretschneideri]
MELVVTSSSVEAGIGCWDLRTGAEQLRYKLCASPPHGLICVGERFLASSQLREPSASSGSVQYWSWSKPQVDVKSFPEEPINPLAANSEGTYIVGGGSSGNIYLWEVNTGRLLKKWHAHYRGVSCLAFSDDGSLLISGSEDGGIRVWSLIGLFDDYQSQQESHLYMHNFTEHTLCVTDVVTGYGGCKAIIVSASQDRTCKVWSVGSGRLLRNIVFPTIIDAIALDPGENVFFAGGRDGKIYVAALNAESPLNSKYGLHIIDCFSNHSKAVTCLAYGITGNYLLSGSEDGVVRVWDARTHNIVRVFKHAKGPVNNILVVRQHFSQMNSYASSRRHGSSLPPPLEKYTTEEGGDIRAFLGGPATCSNLTEPLYITEQVMNRQIKELQQQGSASAEMEIERLKRENERATQMAQQWRKMYDNLHRFCVNELLDGDQGGVSNGNAA